MPDKNYLSSITLPSNSTYYFKDQQAREQIAALVGGDAVIFKGVSSTAITDGGNETPTISGSTVTPNKGNLIFYGTEEFVYGEDSKWHALGSLDSLGALAYKDTAAASYTPSGTVSKPTFTGSSASINLSISNNTSGNYQPKGTVSKPTFSGSSVISTGTVTVHGSVSLGTTNKTAAVSPTTGTATYTPDGTVTAPTISVATAGSTTTIKNPSSVTVAKTVTAAAPGATAPSNAITYYSVSDENLKLYQIGYTTGASITTSNVTVKTTDAAYTASAPDFTGSSVRLVTGNIAVPNTATFTGSTENISVTGTSAGLVSQPTFTGSTVQISGSTTALGSISQPTFTGSTVTITVS